MGEEKQELLEEDKDSKSDFDDDNTELPEELNEVLESVPPKQRKVIERTLMTFQMAANVSSPELTVMKKLTEDHISDYLQGAREEMQKSFEDKKNTRIFLLITLIAAMVFFVAVILILKDMPNIMEKVVYTLGGVIAGAFGGYGIGKNKRE